MTNPMQMFQIINQLKNNPNPMQAMQSMFGNDPRFQQAMQMAQGKNPEEIKQTAMNLCKTKGIDFNQVMNMAQGMGLRL